MGALRLCASSFTQTMTHHVLVRTERHCCAGTDVRLLQLMVEATESPFHNIPKKRFSSRIVAAERPKIGSKHKRTGDLQGAPASGYPSAGPGLQPTLSPVANSLRSHRASDGRQGPEPQADPGLTKQLFWRRAKKDKTSLHTNTRLQSLGRLWQRDA